ncbi:Ribonuclease HII, partial [Bienertia sinuspersici]
MPTNTSWAFKSMVKCARIMLPGCGKRIGNGQSTRIVEDTWAGNLPVKFKRNNPPSHDNAPKYVKELLRGELGTPQKFGIISIEVTPKGSSQLISPNMKRRMKQSGYLRRMGTTRNDNPNPQEVLNLTKLELGRWFRGFGESMEKRDKGNLVLNEKRKETNWSWGNAFQVDNILKIDGAWKKTKNGGIRAAYGWVMERGNRCIREEASRIFAASPLQAEAQAMLEGISSARMDWTTVEVWTDSERMIQ